MKNDKKIEEVVRDMSLYIKNFIEFVDETGNQCAYTDRMVESLIKKATELKELYKNNFKN